MNLSPREMQIMQLVATGMTCCAIGRKIGIKESTVCTYIYRVRVKLDVDNKIVAIVKLVRMGILAG